MCIRDSISSFPDELDSPPVISSPLLKSTPPTVSKALINLYPYLIVADTFLSYLTWSNDNFEHNLLFILGYMIAVTNFQLIIKYFSHLIIIGIIWLYSLIDKNVDDTVDSHPSLDDIIHIMTRVSKKCKIILVPIDALSSQDIKRFLFTTIFLSPVYVIITMFILTPSKLVLISGVFVLTFHSPWCRSARNYLWGVKLFRIFMFYVTGLDLCGLQKHRGTVAKVNREMRTNSKSGRRNSVLSNPLRGSDEKTPKKVKFTFVLFENQRRWLGIGWTSTMLSYERASWTDEFLNQVPDPQHFTLPQEHTGEFEWRWIDKSWKLDMTNDGAIQLPSSVPRRVTNPDPNTGFIYYDNTWKHPSTDDVFSRYTRRRRWVRNAELINLTIPSDDEREEDIPSGVSGSPTNGMNLTLQEIDSQSTGNGPLRDRKVSFSEVNNVRIIPSDDEKLSGTIYEDSQEDTFKQLDSSEDPNNDRGDEDDLSLAE